MYVFILKHEKNKTMPEGQQGLKALTAARNKKSNISNNLQYGTQCHRGLLVLKWGLVWLPGSGRLEAVQQRDRS